MKAIVGPALLLLTSILCTTARADPGLDLIVLVDRSTSMVRHRGVASPFLRMTAELLVRNGGANQVDHRLAVVSFGSSARVDVPLASCRDAGRVRERLTPLRDDDLGDTDVLTALRTAKQTFDAAPFDPLRRRAILLLTDGLPYVRGADMKAYLANLRRFVATELKPQHVLLAVVLLDARHRTTWRGIATSVQLAGGAAEELLAQSHAAIASLVGTHTVEATPAKTQSPVDLLVVPPYLELIVFDVFRGSADAHVEVFPPSSTTAIRHGSGGVEAMRVGNTLMTYVVPRPQPGQWVIRKSGGDARVRIVSQQFFPRGVLMRPTLTDPPRQHDRVGLEYRLLDARGEPLRELEGYALALAVSLVQPDGASTDVSMQRSGATFRSVTEAECALPGRYWTDVRVTTNDDTGRRVEVFRDRWSGFTVTPAQRIDCRVNASGMLAWLPLTAEISCADANGRAADLDAIATVSPASLFRVALWRNGTPADAALDLTSAGLGTLRGKVRGANRSGAYRLQIAADRAKLRPEYNVRVIPTQLPFTRRGWPALVAALTALVAVTAFVLRRKTQR